MLLKTQLGKVASHSSAYGGHITCIQCGGPNHKDNAYCAPDEDTERYKAFLLVQISDTTDDDVRYDLDSTGAHHHMAPTTIDAQGILPYIGFDYVMVGNGSGIPINAFAHVEVLRT